MPIAYSMKKPMRLDLNLHFGGTISWLFFFFFLKARFMLAVSLDSKDNG